MESLEHSILRLQGGMLSINKLAIVCRAFRKRSERNLWKLIAALDSDAAAISFLRHRKPRAETFLMLDTHS